MLAAFAVINMTKVLHIGKYYPPDLGGIESVTETLVTGLRHRGIDADVLCFGKTATTRIENLDGASIVRAGTVANFSSQPISFSFFWQFLRIIKNYQIVHLHTPNPLAAILALIMPRRTKLVVHWHSDIIKQKLLLRFFAPFQYAMLKRAEVIIATSPLYVLDSQALQRFSAKVISIPIGIKPDTSVISDAEVKSIRAQFPGKYLVFSLGRLIYYKGFDYLIEAARQLPEEYVIVIGGVGELGDKLQAQIDAHQLGAKVFLAGRVSFAALPIYYKACDVFCLPSIEKSEAFGVVLLEAMSHGRPIVATKIFGSGVPWVNRDGVSGINVPVRDATALASALQKICEDKELKSKFEKGALTHFQDTFVESIFLTSVISVYEKLMKSGERKK